METRLPVLVRTAFAALLALAAAFPAAARGIDSALEPHAGQLHLGSYLPASSGYDTAVPTPASVLGFEVGEWHVRHDQLVRYLELLAASSPRVALEVQGTTHEGRPQVLLTITSPANQERIEELRRAHLRRFDEGGGEDGGPVVLWLGYSIHGDEASGANAALLVAYHLAAAGDTAMSELLDRTVVLIDPSLNPDGLGRFAAWANSHRGRQPAAAPDHREHHQAWPGGRTNHYWFDLNRDWLLLQHPESRHRLATWRRWRPHLLGDFHEMGSDGTYFFQPGVPLRTNPLSPPANLELTHRIAGHVARAFDRHGVLYFTEEQFDDFYPGKGSTYPDLTGGIGILFEQASARGHRRDTANGPLTFPQAIRHHLLSSLAMLEAARELAPELLAYQHRFVREARDEARAGAAGGWVFSIEEDPVRAQALVELLLRHGLEVRRPAAPVTVGGERFEPATSYLVPADQDGYRLARSLFEVRREFADSTFYDISTWNLGWAFGARWAEVLRAALPALGEAVAEEEPVAGRFVGGSAYAYLLEGRGYYVHRTLRRVLEAGFRARLATRAFEAETDAGRHGFPAGSLVLPAETGADGERLQALLRQAAAEDGVSIYAAGGGLTAGGIDLGSSNARPLTLPRALLVVGEGVSAYEAGEVWHLLDLRFGMEVALVEVDRLQGAALRSFTHVVMVDGDYSRLGDKAAGRLADWVRQGGTVVASKRAADWADGRLLRAAANGDSAAPPPPASTPPAPGVGEVGEVARRPYGDFEEQRQAQRLSGAVLAADIDLSHPLGFGFPRGRIALFANSERAMAASSNPYENLAVFTAEPVLSGYVSPQTEERLAGSAAAVASRLGRGVVVRLAVDPSFRAFWYGTDRLLLNSLFYSFAIEETPPPERWQDPR